MIYFEHNQPHYFVWPCLALGLDDEFWIGIGWLNFEIGWRNGDGGWENEAKLKEQKHMKVEDIHNIYTHMTGRAEGMVMSGGEADFPVMFAEAILDYYKKPWVGLTLDDIPDDDTNNLDFYRGGRWAERVLKEKNNV